MIQEHFQYSFSTEVSGLCHRGNLGVQIGFNMLIMPIQIPQPLLTNLSIIRPLALIVLQLIVLHILNIEFVDIVNASKVLALSIIVLTNLKDTLKCGSFSQPNELENTPFEFCVFISGQIEIILNFILVSLVVMLTYWQRGIISLLGKLHKLFV